MTTEPPEPIRPEYLSWPLEKLQREYFTQGLKLTAANIQNLEYEETAKKVETFLAALQDLQKESQHDHTN